MRRLFELIAINGGAIVSTASLSPLRISQARENDQMWVDENGYGYVWIPKNEILDWTINDNQI
jgi:hypothetical protein